MQTQDEHTSRVSNFVQDFNVNGFTTIRQPTNFPTPFILNSVCEREFNARSMKTANFFQTDFVQVISPFNLTSRDARLLDPPFAHRKPELWKADIFISYLHDSKNGQINMIALLVNSSYNVKRPLPKFVSQCSILPKLQRLCPPKNTFCQKFVKVPKISQNFPSPRNFQCPR